MKATFSTPRFTSRTVERKRKNTFPTRSVYGAVLWFLLPWPPVAKPQKIIGAAVLKFRNKSGLSQERLAEKADIHPNYVGRIERGECQASVEVLFKIAKALNVRLYKFFLKL